MEFKLSFTDKEISPWGVMALMKKLVDKSKIIEKLQEIKLPEPGSNKGFKSEEIIKSFWLSVWCGANKFIHTEVTRQDKVMQQVFGLKAIPSHTTIKGFFNKFNLSRNNEVFAELYQWYFKQLEFDNYILDFDSSVFSSSPDKSFGSASVFWLYLFRERIENQIISGRHQTLSLLRYRMFPLFNNLAISKINICHIKNFVYISLYEV